MDPQRSIPARDVSRCPSGGCSGFEHHRIFSISDATHPHGHESVCVASARHRQIGGAVLCFRSNHTSTAVRYETTWLNGRNRPYANARS